MLLLFAVFGVIGEVLFELDDVTLWFGGVVVFDGVLFEICCGEIFGLIGLNGVGKITCFNVMIGVYELMFGEVWFVGIRINGIYCY